MSGIRRKSSITQTAEIALATDERGERLLWERYERQLPLCGFTSQGLSCRKCFNGPCRINPFGDEPSQGVCGADRDQIVMENVFCTTLEGVLETARKISLAECGDIANDLPDITSDLPVKTREKLIGSRLLPVRTLDLLKVQNSHFSQKGYLLKTLKDLTRLGLIHYGLLKMGEASLSEAIPGRGALTPLESPAIYAGDDLNKDSIRRRENGVKAPSFRTGLTPEGANLLVLGQVSVGLLRQLQSQASQRPKEKAVNIFIQGADGLSSLNRLADHGSPELALTMNLDAIIVGPNAHHPAVEDLAQKFGIPLFLLDEEKKTPDLIASEAIEHAIHHAQLGSYMTSVKMFPAPDPSAEAQLFGKGQEVRAALKKGQLGGIVVLLGEANVKQTFFERTLALMKRCLEQRCLVLLGGELGSQVDLLIREMGGDGLVRDIEGLPSLSCFGSFMEIPRVVAFLKCLAQEERFDKIPAVVALPEFFRASTWAAAVSFLSLGFAVQIGTSLPFWGSPSLTDVLLKDWPKISGGVLMASPGHPDGQTQAQELSAFLKARNAE